MDSGSRRAAAALLARLKKDVAAGYDQFVIAPSEMVAAYGIGGQVEILEDLGPGWQVRSEAGDLIVSRHIPKEAAVHQLEQKLTEIVLSLG